MEEEEEEEREKTIMDRQIGEGGREGGRGRRLVEGDFQSFSYWEGCRLLFFSFCTGL